MQFTIFKVSKKSFENIGLVTDLKKIYQRKEEIFFTGDYKLYYTKNINDITEIRILYSRNFLVKKKRLSKLFDSFVNDNQSQNTHVKNRCFIKNTCFIIDGAIELITQLINFRKAKRQEQIIRNA